jgi:hypothetical protein
VGWLERALEKVTVWGNKTVRAEKWGSVIERFSKKI